MIVYCKNDFIVIFKKLKLMKNSVILFCFAYAFTAFQANGQTYSISFAGTGATTTVSSVVVDNLTKGTTITLNGSDILNLTLITGVNSINDELSSDLKIYPNPMYENSILQFYASNPGNAIVTVFDMTGKMLAQIQSNLDKGLQEFHLSGFKTGSYLISITGITFHYSGKLISNSMESGTICLEKTVSNQIVDNKPLIPDFKRVQSTVNMAYTTGDRLKFTGISGNYSTIKTDVPTSNKTISFNFIACTDGDNKNYPIIELGSQIWMTQNLSTTKYSNGDVIGTTAPATLNITTEIDPKYQWAYDGNEDNVAVYGRLYSWYAVSDSRNICPTGWRVPNDANWTDLTTFLGGESVAGGKLKEIGTSHWQTPNNGATNENGFTALPGGHRLPNGDFVYLGLNGYYWGSEYSITDAYIRLLFYDNSMVFRSFFSKRYGVAVRCIRNP